MLKAGGEVRTIVLTPCGQATAKFVDAQGRPRAGIEPTIEMVVTAGAPSYAPDALLRDELLDDADSVGHIDATNYWPRPKTDDQGRITFPALIPGGTYRLLTAREGKLALAKEFTVKPRETMELGEIVFSGDK